MHIYFTSLHYVVTQNVVFNKTFNVMSEIDDVHLPELEEEIIEIFRKAMNKKDIGFDLGLEKKKSLTPSFIDEGFSGWHTK